MSFTRTAILAVLAAINTAVVVMGLWFTSASIAGGTRVPVFGVKVPAYILGFMVVYIGVRSYIKLFRLYQKIKHQEVRFSWQNFRGGILR